VTDDMKWNIIGSLLGVVLLAIFAATLEVMM
jgi:hypothetical protein